MKTLLLFLAAVVYVGIIILIIPRESKNPKP